MSPAAVGNFIGDLVEMAKAYERLPAVEAELNDATAKLVEHGDRIASREAHIIELKGTIDALYARIRAVEAQRDDAEYRFLELDEKHGSFAKLAQALGKAVGLVEAPPPPVEVPVPEPEPVAEPHVSTMIDDYAPTQAPVSVSMDPIVDPSPATGTGTASEASSSEGSSEVDPTVSTHSGVDNSSGTVPNQPVKSSEDAAPMAEPSPPGPYFGKRWSRINWDSVGGYDEHGDYRSIDQSGRYSFAGWIAGGGTAEGWND